MRTAVFLRRDAPYAKNILTNSLSSFCSFRAFAIKTEKTSSPVSMSSVRVGGHFTIAIMLLTGHSQRAVETDHLAVEHGVFDHLLDQGRVFVRLAESRRERHLRGQ